MEQNFILNQLAHFTGSEVHFQYWGNRTLCYTEGVNYLAKETSSYWLIDEIGCVLLPRLIKEHIDRFYTIQLVVNPDLSAVISVGDGNGKTHLQHKITWTDFPLRDEPVDFYLCDSCDYYCLMLPSEY
ncbi:MAG: DUF6876 family protein [Gammaproteobacteria bacterium]